MKCISNLTLITATKLRLSDSINSLSISNRSLATALSLDLSRFISPNTIEQTHPQLSSFWLCLATGLMVSIAWLLHLRFYKTSQTRLTANIIEQVNHTSEQQLAYFLQVADEGFWDWNLDTDQIYYSPRWKNMLGYQEHELLNNLTTWMQLLHPEDRAQVFLQIQQHLDNNTATCVLEYRLQHKKKGWISILSKAKLAEDASGNVVFPRHLIGSSSDISEVKSREDELIKVETMLDEVHHRIKNNMQGITGILRISAQEQPQFTKPINEAISKLQTLTVIHDLQSRGISSKIKLHELTKAICEANSQLWQVPVQFSVDNEWTPWIITDAEALPIALVLNELILNAIKHSPPPHDVKIKMQNNNHLGCIEIIMSNIGQLPDNFNQDLPLHEGSGIKLARSLLPKAKARLLWEHQLYLVKTTLSLDFSILDLAQEAAQ